MKLSKAILTFSIISTISVKAFTPSSYNNRYQTTTTTATVVGHHHQGRLLKPLQLATESNDVVAEDDTPVEPVDNATIYVNATSSTTTTNNNTTGLKSTTVEELEIIDETKEEEEDVEEKDDVVPKVIKEDGIFSKPTVQDQLLFLQSLGAITGRGEYATESQKKSAAKSVEAIEGSYMIGNYTGTWELVYCSTQLFRSSPFFMAGRAVCTTELQAKQFNWFCDMHRKALAISQILSVRQIVNETRLTSEFEVNVGAIPFLSDFTPFRYSGGLPVSITGSLVSSADITVLDDNNSWEIHMDTVEVKGSNIPGLRQILDNGVKLQSRTLASFLEQTISSYRTPKPIFRTTFLNDRFRISRDQDDNIFVYVKTSDSTKPKDYSKVDADLGIGRLLEGFNDAVTRFYL